MAEGAWEVRGWVLTVARERATDCIPEILLRDASAASPGRGGHATPLSPEHATFRSLEPAFG